jgi:hypothetical protein
MTCVFEAGLEKVPSDASSENPPPLWVVEIPIERVYVAPGVYSTG